MRYQPELVDLVGLQPSELMRLTVGEMDDFCDYVDAKREARARGDVSVDLGL